MAYQSMKDMLEGVEYMGKPKLLERNTVKYQKPNGDMAIRLHRTDIIVTGVNGTVTLSSGGWKTMTTKDRINKYAGVQIHSDKGIWKVSSIPFKDGMVIKANGEVKDMKRLIAQGERDKALAKAISKYTIKIKALPSLPRPSAGDCWCCKGIVRDGDTSHLLDHIKEGYIHGTLIMNALNYAGYVNPEVIFQMFEHRQNDRTSICSAVRRYLKHCLNLVA